ncbi:MAG: YbaK/EbsC family protein [Armatimonadota bacterium]|nr:YbaK/EbsC family protein [Armatimonadota bacterium]
MSDERTLLTTHLIPGKGRGRHLGFPTLNLHIPPDLRLAPGIYACWVRTGQAVYAGALHFGPVPVFGEEDPSLEVHLLDVELKDPPTEVSVEIVRFLRPVQAFDSPEALARQMEEDVKRARAILEADRGVQQVVAALTRYGLSPRILRFPQGTRTAQEAAAALGTTPRQIVKSLVFLADGEPLLVLISGAHRVSWKKLREATNSRAVRSADPQTVQRTTGFPVGAVPPVGLASEIPVYMDEALLHHEEVYAGAGAPDALFAISPSDLRRITGARVADLKQEP